MNNVDLTGRLLDKFGSKHRKIGRYSVTDLYAIKAGWLTAANFFVPEKPDMLSIKRMWNGIIVHNMIESLLDKTRCEQKVEYPYKDIVLVGKADYLPIVLDEVWDFKTSEKTLTKAKPWQEEQIKVYCSLFEKKTGRLLQPEITEDSVVLRDFGSVMRDDDWFHTQLEGLYVFHKYLKEFNEKK